VERRHRTRSFHHGRAHRHIFTEPRPAQRARFDEKRLLWVNGQFIRDLSLDELANRVEYFWSDSAKKYPEDYKRRVLVLIQDRLKTLKDVPGLSSYFFEEPTPNWSLITDNKQLGKLSRDEVTGVLRAAHDALSIIDDWSPETLQTALNTLLETTQQKPAVLFGLIRIATTWAPFSPQLGDTLALLGKDTTLARLERAIQA
jgi:glutamyl/glutaminyl-tRNA synthetase